VVLDTHEVWYTRVSNQDAVHPDGAGALESNPRQVSSLGRLYVRITAIRIPKKVLAIIRFSVREKKSECHCDNRHVDGLDAVGNRNTFIAEHPYIRPRGVRQHHEGLVF
jgi:hypothetical protein